MKPTLTLLPILLLAPLACCNHAAAGESIYYVSPDGDDAWSGRLASRSPSPENDTQVTEPSCPRKTAN